MEYSRMGTLNPAARLQELRHRSGLTLRAIAKKAGYKGASSIQRYFNPDEYDRDTIDPETIGKLAKALMGTGEPPITAKELYVLCGYPVDFDHTHIATKRSHGDNGHATFGGIVELDVRASMGAGAIVESENVTGEWQVPADLFRGQTSAPLGALRIITAYGDSMEPEIPPGARVAVDISDKRPSPPGIFVVFDGVGLVIKRVEVVPFSDPVTVRLSSDNSHYKPYERVLDEAYIQGRVIGQWRWR